MTVTETRKISWDWQKNVLYVKPYVNHDIVNEVENTQKLYIWRTDSSVNFTWVNVKIIHTNGSKEKF